jgi:hypothetical protein
MFSRSRSTLVLSALLVSFAAAGCKSSPPQLPQFQTAGLRISVLKAVNRKDRVEVAVKIWNDHDVRVNFDLGDVRLLFNGREVSPTPGRGVDREPDVQAKSPREFKWLFEVGDVVGEGQYPIEIRNMTKGDAPVGEPAKFDIILGP